MAKSQFIWALGAIPALWLLQSNSEDKPKIAQDLSLQKAGGESSYFVGDLNHDGLADIVLIPAFGQPQIFQGNLEKGFDNRSELSPDLAKISGPGTVWVGDFNSDGRMDLCFSLGQPGNLSLVLYEGLDNGKSNDIRFETASLAEAGIDSNSKLLDIQPLDSDGDGKIDFLIQSANGKAKLYRNISDSKNRKIRFESSALEFTAATNPQFGVIGIGLQENGNGETRKIPATSDAGSETKSSGDPVVLVGQNTPSGDSGTPSQPRGGDPQESTACPDSILNTAAGATDCIQASRVPTLNKLYPLTDKFFIDASNNRVGIGTLTPRERVQIGEQIAFHDGGRKALAINGYYDGAAGTWKRQVAGRTLTQEFNPTSGDLRFYIGSNGAAGAASALVECMALVRKESGSLAVGNLGIGTGDPGWNRVSVIQPLTTGSAGHFYINERTNSSPSLQGVTNGTGPGVYAWSNNYGPAVRADAAGSGIAVYGFNALPTNAAPAIFGDTLGSGPAIKGVNRSANGGLGGEFQGNVLITNVPLNVPNPLLATLVVDNGGGTNASLKLEQRGSNLLVRPAAAGQSTTIVENQAGALALNPNANVLIGTAAPIANDDAKLRVQGKTKTCILEITGGCDLAESFEVSPNETIESGMVVAIDAENPGKLKLAKNAYDTTVAGIVSGAGGVNVGMKLSQEGVLEGSHPVALSGRVYCWVDASFGEVKPGDLLTSSSTAGHAMKASDRGRATGAILGKALTPLKSGRGLVLVIVSLQ